METFTDIHMVISTYKGIREKRGFVTALKLKMDEKSFSKYFKAFSDKSRLRILLLLSSKELAVNEIAAAVGLSQPTVSRHLGILREAGVVTDRREGQQVHYSINRGVVAGCCADFCDCLDVSRSGTKKAKKK